MWGGSLVTSYPIWIRCHEVTHLTSLDLLGGNGDMIWCLMVDGQKIATQKVDYRVNQITSASNFRFWICGVFFQVLVSYFFFFHESELRTDESVGPVFWRDTFASHRDMFTALRCQEPEELTMCRACCGPSALHPVERPFLKKKQIFWSIELIPERWRRCWFNT